MSSDWPGFLASYVPIVCDYHIFSTNREMAAFESHKIKWIKTAIFCCFVVLCGITYYAYDSYSAYGDPIESHLDDIKLRRRNKEHPNRSSKVPNLEHYESINIFSQPSRNLQGYVIPYNVYEQQTAGARNLWGLQLWANTVGMKVVEPFINNKTMTFQPIIKRISNCMRFSDFYDMEYWNKQCMSKGGAELVPWKEFLSMASKNIIFVQLCGHRLFSCHTEIKTKANLHDALMSIDSTKRGISKKAIKYFSNLGFKFVRWVAIEFNETTRMTLQEFSQYIFDQYDVNHVTVMFENWLGICRSRVNLQGIRFVTNSKSICLGLLPSKKVVADSQRYLQHVRHSDGKYFGIMVRVQKAYSKMQSQNNYKTINGLNFMRDCAKNISNLEEIRNHKDWDKTLAIDLGNFGSYAYRSQDRDKEEKVLYDDFFKAVYGNSWTTEEFENSFIKYLGTNNPTYIAQVQRTIAAMSDCIVLIGGGSTFQAAAIEFYKNFHPNVKKQCIIFHCYLGVNLDLK